MRKTVEGCWGGEDVKERLGVDEEGGYRVPKGIPVGNLVRFLGGKIW